MFAIMFNFIIYKGSKPISRVLSSKW